AAVRLAGKVRRTPVLELRGEDFGVAARVVLKLEHMQHTGSFKPRGALHALLTRDIPPAGVVAASGGNHGAAVAWAAARLGVPATIFVPATSPPAKAARIASYGARVHVVEGFYDEAMVAAQTYAADLDVTSVHAFDEPAVVAGQGTLGLEVREQVPDASAVLVTVGGGGLAAGVTLACRDGGPSVVPIEPDSCPTLAAALDAGGPVDVAVGGIAADSTGARRAGQIGFQVFREAAIGVRSVPDEAIVAAQHVLWERCRIATEPGGAVACAGLLAGAFVPEPGGTVVVVICGANTATLP
ncbi:MAG TPA: serine/threonine dehydratase, partial [Jiangellaceae bacterium]|nr:serine/threonine dehydratase [Jiangellaceae bacterium]